METKIIKGEKSYILNKIKSVLEQTAPGSEIYLFGSRARGTAKKASDWDLLILLDAPQVSFEFETTIMNNLYEIELETGEIVSPLIYTKHDWNLNYSATPFYSNIQKEGVRIK